MSIKRIWKQNFLSSETDLLTTKLVNAIEQDRISKEKILLPFWNKQSTELSNKIWLPTIDTPCKISSPLSIGKSWFSINKTEPEENKHIDSPLFSHIDCKNEKVLEIRETSKITFAMKDDIEVDYKTLIFNMYPTDEEEKILGIMSNQTKWYSNMSKDIFLRENPIKELKEKLKTEKEDQMRYRSELKEIKKLKTKKEQKDAIKRLEKPVLTKFYYSEFRDKSMQKYDYIEQKINDNTVLLDFKYNEDRKTIPNPEWWDNNLHSRIPRGAIKNFIQDINSNITNYRNSGRDFSLNYKTSKSKKEHIFFEDKQYPKFIDSIASRYSYTKNINGKKKRVSISFKEIQEYLEIKSLVIVYDKSIEKYYLHLAVSKEFYLPDDKRSENQTSFSKESIIALDPGVRTPIAGYSPNETIFFGDGCCKNIFNLQLQLDKLEIEQGMSEEEIKMIKLNRRVIRFRIKNLVEDLHWKTIKYLTSNYNIIIYPDFRTKGMMKKLPKVVNRLLSTLSFFKFKERLIYKCKVNKNILIITNEAYTSRTCTGCGFLNEKSKNKNFQCKNCNFKIDRDINGARNIFIKTISILSDLKLIFTL